jgi:hypothetical protein
MLGVISRTSTLSVRDDVVDVLVLYKQQHSNLSEQHDSLYERTRVHTAGRELGLDCAR